MPININSTMAGLEPYEYNFILRSPNGMMINNILGVFDIDFNPRLETVSNLKLKIAKYVTYKNEEIENPVWDYLEEPFLISLNDEITFRIDEVSFSADENNGVTKEVTALSLENEMSSKLVQNFKSTINDEANPQTIDVILNDYLAEKLNNLWKIGNTDGEVMTRLRLVPDTDEKTLYEFFKDVQVAYNCIFKYDSSIDPITRRPKRLIHIYDNTTYKVCPNCGSDIFYQDNYQHCKNPNCAKDGVNKDVSDDYVWSKAIYGLDSGLIITDTNYIKNYNEKFEKPVTRLYVKGADDLDIILANPTGQDYIEDFSYYRNEKYMSPELLEALDRYDVVVKENESAITTARENLNKATVRKTNLLYGNISNIAEDLAMVEGWLDRANEYFNDWYSNKNEDALDNANNLLDTVDDWFKTSSSSKAGDYTDNEGNTWSYITNTIGNNSWYYTAIATIDGKQVVKEFTYGIENLQRLYNVYDERISIIGQLNDKLKYTKEDGEYLLQNTLDDNNLDTRNLDTRFDGINVSNLTEIRNQISTAITNLNKILSTVESDIESYQNELSNIRLSINTYYATDNPEMYENAFDSCLITINAPVINNSFTFSLDDKYLKDKNFKPESFNSLLVRRYTENTFLTRTSKDKSDLEKDEYCVEINYDTKEVTIYFSPELFSSISNKNEHSIIVKCYGAIFTEDLIKELNLFIIEGTYTNDTIGTSADIGSEEYINACEELYKDGLIAMKEKHEPLMSVDADIIDLLSCCDCAIDSARIGIGNIIRVQHSESPSKKNNYANMIFRIVEYSHNPMSNSLSLTLSNTEHFKSDRSSVATLLNKASSTSSVVSISKGSWNRAEQNAVDTIINDGLNTAKTTIQCADNQRSVIDNRGITMGSYVDSESDKQVRLMNTGFYLTDDNWKTIKLAATGDGIIANRLIGNALIGKTLMLQASDIGEDGKTKTVFARFDTDGFSIGNTKFSVGNVKDDGSGQVDFKGQGFFVDPDNGVIVRSNGTSPCEIRLNPNSGYRCSTCGHVQDTKGNCKKNGCEGTASELVKAIEVVTVNSQGDTTTNHMYFDRVNNKFLVNGSILAKDLFLTKTGEENKSIIDFIEDKLNNRPNSNDSANDQVNKIKGDYIEGRGLKAYDKSGNIRVEIDGNTGGLDITDGYIKLQQREYDKYGNEKGVVENGNTIYIDPKDGMVFHNGKTGEDVIKLDIQYGSATFSGDIDTTKDVRIGENLYVRDNEDKIGCSLTAKGDVLSDDIVLSSHRGRPIQIKSDGNLTLKAKCGAAMYMQPGTGIIGSKEIHFDGTVTMGSIANKDGDNKLVTMNQMESWVSDYVSEVLSQM